MDNLSISIKQAKELYENETTSDKKYKKTYMSQVVNLDGYAFKDCSYCDIMFKDKKKEYMIVFKMIWLKTEEYDNDVIKCISI